LQHQSDEGRSTVEKQHIFPVGHSIFK